MVGGYAILCNRVFTPGEYDLVELYGSYESAIHYLGSLLASGKPILVSCLVSDTIFTGWLQATSTTGSYTFAGVVGATIVRNDSDKTLKLQIVID